MEVKTESKVTEQPPKVARFDLSVGIDTEMWNLLKDSGVSHMTEKQLEENVIDDIRAAITQYRGYHSLIDKDSGVVDITLTKYY